MHSTLITLPTLPHTKPTYIAGEVTAWQEADLAYIRAVMSWEIPPIPAAGRVVDWKEE